MAVVGDDVVLGPAGARELGDAGAPGEAQPPARPGRARCPSGRRRSARRARRACAARRGSPAGGGTGCRPPTRTADSVKTRCGSVSRGDADRLEHRLRLASCRRRAGASSSAARSPSAADSSAIAWRSRAAASSSSSTRRSSSSRCSRTASSSASAASCAASHSSSALAAAARRGLALGRRRGARPGAPRPRGARLGVGERALGAGLARAVLVALALGVLRACAARRRAGGAGRRRAAPRARPGARGRRAPLALLERSRAREQRAVGEAGVVEELLPRPEDLGDRVGVRHVLARQPVARRSAPRP